MIRLPEPIAFEWDDGNREKNRLKHQASNAEAEEVFFDPHKRMAKDILHSMRGEARFILLGQTRFGRLLFVVFTIREKKVRVISARDMNKRERPQYER